MFLNSIFKANETFCLNNREICNKSADITSLLAEVYCAINIQESIANFKI